MEASRGGISGTYRRAESLKRVKSQNERPSPVTPRAILSTPHIDSCTDVETTPSSCDLTRAIPTPMIARCAGYSHWLWRVTGSPFSIGPIACVHPSCNSTSTCCQHGSRTKQPLRDHVHPSRGPTDLTYLSYTWLPIVTARPLFAGCISISVSGDISMAPIDFRQPPSLSDLGHHGPEPGPGFHKGSSDHLLWGFVLRRKKHSQRQTL